MNRWRLIRDQKGRPAYASGGRGRHPAAPRLPMMARHSAHCDAVVRSDDHGRIATFDYCVQGRDPSVVIGPHKPADEPDTAVDEPWSR
jgi:hypothetical protein